MSGRQTPGSRQPRRLAAAARAAGAVAAARRRRRSRRPRAAGARSAPTGRTPPRAARAAGRCAGRRRACPLAAYLSWNGYGVLRPSDGGKLAVLTAFSTQEPVGVPANLPVTVAVETFPFLPMTTFTIAIPGTLYWL